MRLFRNYRAQYRAQKEEWVRHKEVWLTLKQDIEQALEQSGIQRSYKPLKPQLIMLTKVTKPEYGPDGRVHGARIEYRLFGILIYLKKIEPPAKDKEPCSFYTDF